MNSIYWWIIFGLNFLLYGLCCIIIIKRKNYTSISIRSPTLLLSTILGNFFIITIILLYQIFENNIISSFYYIFRVMLFLSIILRYQRILLCCKIDKMDKQEIELDRKEFSDKRFLFQEKFYVRILLVVLVIFLVMMIAIKLIGINQVEMFYTFNYIHKFEEQTESFYLFKVQMLIWIIWNFIEQFILITYIFKTFSKIVEEKIKMEILCFFILWFIYGFTSTFFNYYYPKNNDENISFIIIIVSLCVHYLSLFLNGYYPIILSFLYKISISYHFSPKLMNNLYLFLTNEKCYDTFTNYLIRNNNNKCIYFLQLYTHIIKYKLSFVLNINRNIGFNDANEIYNTYFSKEETNYIDENILKKVKNECLALKNNTFTPELFDEALQFTFNELSKIFYIFRGTNDYKNLYNEIKLQSYIQCKMCNTGLINKY